MTIGMCTRRSYHAGKSKKQSETGRAESEVKIEGCRIINMDRLQEYTDNLTEHSRTCEGSITLIGENRNGLASVLKSVLQVQPQNRS